MLGTGTPRPDPSRSGPATAIIAGGAPYLIDFGPGIVRRAAAAFEKGITAFGPCGANITTAFLTHMHSDHTVGYPDLILTPWVMGRREPLRVYGPKGIEAMTAHILQAWQIDIAGRRGGHNGHNATGCTVDAHEIASGVIFQDGNVTVTAFAALHQEMADSFSFRFDAGDRSIVISGDTAPTPAMLEYARGCDLLVHEAYAMASYRAVSLQSQEFRRTHHTSSAELAAIANAVRPKLLVIYHRSNAGRAPEALDSDEILLDEIRQSYAGPVVAAHDLDVY